MYNNTLATVKRQIQQAQNPTPAVVISVEAAGVNNAILLNNMTSEVVLEESVIGSTDPIIPIDNSCMDDELYFGMLGGSREYKDESDEGDERDTIPTTSWQPWAESELERFDLGTSDVHEYEGDDCDYADADADEEEAVWQDDDGSMQNVED